MSGRVACGATSKAKPAPDGWSLEAQRQHPGYGPRLDVVVPCEREFGHKGPHRNGLLTWHDPPQVFVGGEHYEPSRAPWRLLGKRID